MNTELTHEQLLFLLDYNPESGRFIWKNSERPSHNGKVAGKIGRSKNFNYATIGLQVGGKTQNFCISRLAWFFVHGVWPVSQLRFINGDPSNTRIDNLEERVAKKRYKQGKRHDDASLPEHTCKPQTFVESHKYSLKYRFGITPEQYAEMLVMQKGVCAICSQPETVIFRGKIKQLGVDHDHETGKIRSLLCSQCNSGLGYFKDSPRLLAGAIGYLRRHASDDSNNVVPLRAVTSGDSQ